MRFGRTVFNWGSWCAVAAVLGIASGASAVSFYQVGNSFTNDSRAVGIAAMFELATAAPVEYGYHIRGNQTLQSLWSNPTAPDTLTTPYGDHTVALPNNDWDFLTLQTFPDYVSVTLGEEVARIADFVAAADQGGAGEATIIVYGPWAGNSESVWVDWYEPVVASPDLPATASAAYQDLLFDEVEALFPGRVRLASAGKVIREVRDQILAKEIDIAAPRMLYRDHIHLNNLGRYIAATTLFTVMSQTNPVGMPVPRNVAGWDELTLPDDLALDLQQIVWDVVVEDLRSGVSPLGDFNVDTKVDELDYELWRQTYGAQTAVTYDPNGDGVVNEIDEQLLFDAWDPGGSDLNGDGVTTIDDLSVWQSQYGSLGPNGADANGDGVVDAADYTVWRDQITLSQSVDFNQDGRVNELDHALLRSQFGWATKLLADENGDGVVDAADYTIWRDAYAAATALAVPEPSALAIVIILGVSLVARRPFVRGVDAA